MDLRSRVGIGAGELRDEFAAGVNVFLHFAVLGIITIASGRPFLFPSLGPSAYLMATGEQPREEGAYHVIGGHTVAIVGGMVAYALFAVETSTYVVFQRSDPAFSSELITLSVSGATAMVITTVAMLLTKTNHPAACATTLIVALGLMGGLVDAAVIIAAVAILTFLHEWAIAPFAKYWGFKPEEPRS